MFLEAVTTCVGYADFLAETIGHNAGLFDRWLVITTPRDEATRALCRQHNLECLLTDDFSRDERSFNKARGIDRGLHLLSHRDWVLHIDADIVLPPHLRTTLECAHLDPECVYGCDRVMVKGWDRWQKLKASGFLTEYSRCHHWNVCLPGGFDVGARWADTDHGWCPIGFFQLWSGQASHWIGHRFRRYSAHGHADAARTDVQFALQWDRRQRVLIPELVAFHLESEGASVGANWQGRTTAAFGPPNKAQATVPAAAPLAQPQRHRHHPPPKGYGC